MWIWFRRCLTDALPMHVNVEAREKIVYRSYQELSVAYANKGVSLEAIEKLKQLDLKAERRNVPVAVEIEGGRRRSPQATRLEVANRKPRARRSTP